MLCQKYTNGLIIIMVMTMMAAAATMAAAAAMMIKTIMLTVLRVVQQDLSYVRATVVHKETCLINQSHNIEKNNEN